MPTESSVQKNYFLQGRSTWNALTLPLSRLSLSHLWERDTTQKPSPILGEGQDPLGGQGEGLPACSRTP